MTIQSLTQGVESGETDTFSLACLEYGQVDRRKPDLVCQLNGSHLPLGKHHIDVYNDWHGLLLLRGLILDVFLVFGCRGTEIFRKVETCHLEQVLKRRHGTHQTGDETGSR